MTLFNASSEVMNYSETLLVEALVEIYTEQEVLWSTAGVNVFACEIRSEGFLRLAVGPSIGCLLTCEGFIRLLRL